VTLTNWLKLRGDSVGGTKVGRTRNRRAHVARILAPALVIAVCLSSLAFGSGREYLAKQAAKIVGNALRFELEGKNDERGKMRKQAAEQFAEFLPAKWHQGYVRLGKR